MHRHVPFTRVTWLIQHGDWHCCSPVMCPDSFICVTWLIDVCAMTHSYVCHDSFRCFTWPRCKWWLALLLSSNKTQLIKICDMTHSYVWHDSFICGQWLIRMSVMIHPYVSPVIKHNVWRFVTWLIHMCDMTHLHVCCVSFISGKYLIPSGD